jgi:hypothetical protein
MVERSGKHILTYDSPHSCVVKVDGRTVLDDRPIKRAKPLRTERTLNLSAGVHRVELLVDFGYDGPPPYISFRAAGIPNAPALPMAALPVSSH